jgi:hypothetical protein
MVGGVVTLLTLQSWAAAVYGEAAPAAATLRRWARDGLICPAPEKHGRSYFVQPNARYLDHRSIRHATTPARTLTEKLARSSALP